MKRQGTREKGNKGPERLERLLRRAVPPIGDRAESSEDLWPAMVMRMHSDAVAAPVTLRVPWFDWALAGGLLALLALFPAWIPVLLYYL